VQYRDTKARLRKDVRFLGVDGGVLPLCFSGCLSAVFLVASFSKPGGDTFTKTVISMLPFVSTYLYLLIFRTGRRPHFDRDLLYWCLYGKAVSPAPPKYQPVHPVLGRGPRKHMEDGDDAG
jgi:hypothetical protein